MNISFSKEEEEAAQQLIKELERRSRRWPWVRWVGIVVSTAVFFSSILLGSVSQRLFGETLPKLELSIGNFNPEYLKLYIDYSISLNRAKEHIETAQAIAFFGSLFFLIYFLANRNRGARAGLLAKFVRQTLDKGPATGQDQTDSKRKAGSDDGLALKQQ